MALTPTVELGLGGSLVALAQTVAPDSFVAWPMRRQVDASLAVVVPELTDTSGGVTFASAYAGDLARAGSPAFAAGDLPEGGSSIVLDGVDDALTAASSGGAPGTEPMSLEVVLVVTATPGGGVEPAIWGQSGFGLTYRSDGRVYGYYNGSAVVDAPLALDSAAHVVLSRTGASPDVVTLSINGVSVDSATPARVSFGSLGTLHCGKHWTNAHYLTGRVSWLAFYGTAMTAGQVSANYAATAWTDVTSDTRGAVPLVIDRGIRSDMPSQRVASTGTCTFALNNLASNSGGVTGYYSPGHASCRGGFAKGIAVRVTVGGDAVFVGRVRSIAPTPGKMSGVYTSVVATDFLDRCAAFLLETPPILESVRGDQVMQTIVGLMPAQPHGLTLFAGSETYTLALDNTRDEDVPVLREFQRLASSELGYIYCTRSGGLVYESRTTRRANQDEARATFADTMVGLDPAEVSATSVNRVQLTVHPRVIDAAATTVLWALVNPLEMQAGETKTLVGPYRTESAPGITTRVGGLDMVTPASTTDYTMNDASDGSGSDRTADLGVTANFGPNGVQWVLTNNHTGRAYVTKLQCRGKGVYDFRTVVVRKQNDDAIADDGVSALTFDMVYQEDPNVAQALAQDLLTAYGDLSGTRARSMTVLPDDPGLPADLHTYDISDRVAVSETISGATGEYYINGVRLECQSGRLASLKWWLAPAEFPVAMTAVAYAAGNFTSAGGGTWTVDSGDQVTYAYQVVGKMMDLVVWVQTTSISGTVNTCRFAIPGGYVANRNTPGYAYILDNGSYSDANARVSAAGTYVEVGRGDNANFAAATNATQIRLTIRFEVQ
jgi:hypothetical protein